MAKKSRRFGFMEVFLVLLIAIVVLAIFALVLALMYPDATSTITRDVREAASSGKSPTLAFAKSVLERAEENIDLRIKPFADAVIRRFASIGTMFRDTSVSQPKIKDFKADDCLECHENLFEQRGFANIFVNHRVHAALEIKCSECHEDTKHPKPKSIAKKTCVNCHEQTGVAADCGICHAPGSILSDEIIPKEKTREFLAGSAAAVNSIMPTSFGSPDPKWLTGERDAPCRKCHEVPNFCNRCHLVFHNRISNWKQVHGPRLLRQEYIMNACWTCHNATWCAGTCHANLLKRRESFRPLPHIPLERYLEY